MGHVVNGNHKRDVSNQIQEIRIVIGWMNNIRMWHRMEVAPNIPTIKVFNDFVSSFEPVRREKMSVPYRLQFRQVPVVGIPDEERWVYAIHGRELLHQFTVVAGDAAVLLE
jgi:hypothetical protein